MKPWSTADSKTIDRLWTAGSDYACAQIGSPLTGANRKTFAHLSLSPQADCCDAQPALFHDVLAHDPRPEVSTRGFLIVHDFKEMDRLPVASGFSAIQNNSGLSQGLSPRLAAQSTTRAIDQGYRRSPVQLGNTEMGH